MPLAWLLALLPAAMPAAPDTAVVCPAEFRAALDPWVKYRTGQGHKLAFVASNQSASGIRDELRELAKAGALKFVVLVGDADPRMQFDPALRARCVPTHLVPAKVNVRFGSEPQIASDHWYADLDADGVPELAVGRMTADTAAELRLIVAKVLHYEQSRDFNLWRRRVNFVAGVGGFGRLIDGAVEAAAKRLITDGIPASFATSMTQASWTSPFCPDPRDFCQATVGRLNEGCLFWVYLGHGQSRNLDALRVPGAAYPILSERDVPKLRGAESGIACFLACYAAAFDKPEDCLGEQMLRSPGGPVAVIGGSRVTMPYAMSVLGMELINQCFVEQSATLGEALQGAKREMLRSERKNQNRELLDSLASLISPTNLAEERTEHLHLFNLLGDPLLSLRHGRAVEFDSPTTATAGDTIDIQGACPISGRCTVELVVRRDRLTFDAPARDKYDPSPAALAVYNEVYKRANDPRLDQTEVLTQDGRFAARLKVPTEAQGACHVRIYVAGADDFAIGARDLTVVRADTVSRAGRAR